MPRLRTCYFCGAVGDSLQEYDLVPEELVAPDRSRSAVLCSTCHEKLRRVLEPLVDAAESSDPTTTPQAGPLPEVTFESDTASTDGDERGTDPDITESDTDGSRNGERNGAAESTADESGDDTDDASADDVSAGASDARDGESDGEATDGESDGSSGADESDLPDDYYKVLRLLQNREFPMERDDLTALVTSAYDVSPPQCERILETAVDRGVLVEDGSTIDLGRN